MRPCVSSLVIIVAFAYINEVNAANESILIDNAYVSYDKQVTTFALYSNRSESLCDYSWSVRWWVNGQPEKTWHHMNGGETCSIKFTHPGLLEAKCIFLSSHDKKRLTVSQQFFITGRVSEALQSRPSIRQETPIDIKRNDNINTENKISVINPYVPTSRLGTIFKFINTNNNRVLEYYWRVRYIKKDGQPAEWHNLPGEDICAIAFPRPAKAEVECTVVYRRKKSYDNEFYSSVLTLVQIGKNAPIEERIKAAEEMIAIVAKGITMDPQDLEEAEQLSTNKVTLIENERVARIEAERIERERPAREEAERRQALVAERIERERLAKQETESKRKQQESPSGSTSNSSPSWGERFMRGFFGTAAIVGGAYAISKATGGTSSEALGRNGQPACSRCGCKGFVAGVTIDRCKCGHDYYGYHAGN